LEIELEDKLLSLIHDPACQKILLKNIKSFVAELSSQPTLQNFVASKLTNGLSREQASQIAGISVWKIDRGRQLCQSFRLSDLTLKVSFIFKTNKNKI
jgi:hypothetical protein